jgi:predicted RNA-binding protein
MPRSYWLDLFTGTTWEEFLAAGGEVSGFRERRWKTVQQMKPGDYLLCYLTGISRWIGVLEVVSEPYRDTTPSGRTRHSPAGCVCARLPP